MADQRPNILFLLPDQHRPDFLGTNPDIPVRTPNLDALAARGVQFTNAVTPSPLCAPARACLAAGKAYHRCRVPSNHVDYPLDQPTFYAALRDSGYNVAGVGKFDLHKATLDWGLDGKRLLHEWGFTHGIDNEGKFDGARSGAEQPKGPYLAYLHQRGLGKTHAEDLRGRSGAPEGYVKTYPTPLPDDAYCDNWLSDNGINILRELPKDQPWFMQVNFTGPHSPMDVTERMLEGWRDVEFLPPPDSTTFDAETHNRIRQNYAAMIENIDRNIGRFLQEVEARGELDNTLIVFSSDHGEMLGDHDEWGKSTWYRPSAGVPMIAAGPGVAEGRTSDALVQLYDLAATFLDYAQLPPLPEADAESLGDLFGGKADSHRDVLVCGLSKWRMIRDDRYKLVLRDDNEPLLFDLVDDPDECTTIAGDQPEKVQQLTKRLEKELTK